MADEIVRDPKGRFVKGHSGNPKGKPIDQFKYLKKMGAAVSATEWREIIRRAVEQAKRGDPRAREWLSDYLMGKPPQQVDVTSNGETIVDNVQTDRALSALADAIRASLYGEGTDQVSDLGTSEPATVASSADQGG